MWDETLIESMGQRSNGKRWLTVQIAAIAHACVVAILAAASFWHVDVMSLPIQSRIIVPTFFSENVPGSTPIAQGIPRQRIQQNLELNNQIPVRTEPVTQEQLVPEDTNSTNPTTPASETDIIGDLPEGSPDGVPGADPSGTGSGGPGGPGLGTGSDQPIEEGQFGPLGVEQPVVTHRVEPEYPQLLLRAHKEGTVILEAVISRNGDVQQIRILRSDHSLFAQSAVHAVSQWKYRPAFLGDKPIAVYFKVTVQFKLR